MTKTTGSLTCPHNLLMHAYTHAFAFIYSVKLNGCLFHWGVGCNAPFFFGGEGSWAPFYEILEATLKMFRLKCMFMGIHTQDALVIATPVAKLGGGGGCCLGGGAFGAVYLNKSNHSFILRIAVVFFFWGGRAFGAVCVRLKTIILSLG